MKKFYYQKDGWFRFTRILGNVHMWTKCHEAEDISQYVDPKPLSRRPIFLMTCRGELGLPYKTNAGISGREGVNRGPALWWMSEVLLQQPRGRLLLLFFHCFFSFQSFTFNTSLNSLNSQLLYWWSNPCRDVDVCQPELPMIWYLGLFPHCVKNCQPPLICSC